MDPLGYNWIFVFLWKVCYVIFCWWWMKVGIYWNFYCHQKKHVLLGRNDHFCFIIFLFQTKIWWLGDLVEHVWLIPVVLPVILSCWIFISTSPKWTAISPRGLVSVPPPPKKKRKPFHLPIHWFPGVALAGLVFRWWVKMNFVDLLVETNAS